MEFIKTIKIEDNVYKVFYDSNLKAINYFYHVEDTGETDCITIIYDTVRKIYDVLTEESFKNNFETIMSDVVSMDNAIERHLVLFQTFKKGFWNEMVMTKFKDCEIGFIQQ